MPILKEAVEHDELVDKVVVTTTYDNESVLRANEIDRQDIAPKAHKKFRDGVLSHVMRIDLGDVTRLKNLGYDLLSPDPDERRRALLYVQANEAQFLTVHAKPFAKKTARWI